MAAHGEQLKHIRSFPQLVKYLRDELDWPIETEQFDDLTFEYEPDELGLDPKTAVKINKIRQLRPLVAGQSWGVFFIDFEPKRLPIVVLRRILQNLTIKKRKTAKAAERPAWHTHDLLFISSYGDDAERCISFAHFSEPPEERLGDIPTLRVLGWDEQDTVLHLDHAERALREKLSWQRDGEAVDAWRARWSSAFILKPREVIRTAQELAERLADLARGIRRRANQILAIESERGPLRKLFKAFKEALIHDLSEDDFADMYAQTITYGLFSAACSRTAPDRDAAHGERTAVVADDLVLLAGTTSPFLRETLEDFLKVGGRRGKMDFDELGIQDVVDLLNSSDTHLLEVLEDFGRQKRQEDPVIHFYESFLKEYDAKKKVQRGVFYTPQPVVSYIVRSVHEILQKEFVLEDGLASTVTWGEMAKRNKDLAIPKDTKPDEFFVNILDPATGTATFLVEVVDVIYKTMTARWRKEGRLDLEFDKLWNEYVPKSLLPRLYGYELMAAPYVIAHIRLGLKLGETGFRFTEKTPRVNIYLTNSLEPPSDVQPELEVIAPALAHEAKAVNAIKRHKQFSVVVGNPPYAGLSSNMTEYAQHLVDAYKIVDGAALNERKLWLQDDYVKFMRFAQMTIEDCRAGVMGYITNHGYLDNPTFRGMRQSLMGTFSCLRVLDLHGNANKKEQAPDGCEDNNVFDIRQGVAICLGAHGPRRVGVRHLDIWGSREAKYAWLLKHHVGNTEFSLLQPDSPFYFFEPQNVDCRLEYNNGWKITDIFCAGGVGVVMARDSMTVDFDVSRLWDRVRDFATLAPEKARAKYELGKDARDWRVATAQADVRASGPSKKNICSILYRPFDYRFTYFTGNSRGFYASPCRKVMSNMIRGSNLALVTSRSVEIGRFEHAFCTNGIIGHHSVSLKEVNYLCPLWLLPEEEIPGELLKCSGDRVLNLGSSFLSALGASLSLKQTDSHGLPSGINPPEIFGYIYAILFCPRYRTRYADFLRSDFPRIPLAPSLDLFRALAKLGEELVALHLMESPKLEKHITKWIGSTPSDEVEKLSYADKTVWIDKGQSEGFKGVPEEVWNFHIGGYHVCEKWLKDRKGRKLSKADIEHYHRIVVALSETIRLMAEIDKVIEKYGGWPGAFSVKVGGKTGA